MRCAQTAARCVFNTTLSAATCGLVASLCWTSYSAPGPGTWAPSVQRRPRRPRLDQCGLLHRLPMGGRAHRCHRRYRLLRHVPLCALRPQAGGRPPSRTPRAQALPQIQLHAPLGSTERTPPPLGAPSPSLPNSCGDALHFLALLLRAGGLVGAFPLFWFFRILIAAGLLAHRLHLAARATRQHGG
jgi:hypothetical protein